jgi:hypothetical protein
MGSLLRWLPLGLLACLTACGPAYRVWARGNALEVGCGLAGPAHSVPQAHCRDRRALMETHSLR